MRAACWTLLRLPHVWMKLSAPYRVSPDPLATRPDRPWLDAILSCAEERCVWGSDWPHTPPHDDQGGPMWWGAIARCPTNAWSTISSRRWARRARADRIMRDNAGAAVRILESAAYRDKTGAIEAD